MNRLEDLAGLAPTGNYESAVPFSPATPSPSPGVPAKTGKTAKPLRGKVSLGSLDMGAYLTHYGKSYTVKQRGAVTSYVLDVCLFDENHRGGEARLDTSPNPPFITYNCFHQSCNYDWKAARRIISGAESLAPFCAGYDPNWQAPQPAGEGKLRDIHIAPICNIEVAPSRLPPPDEIDPMEFYEKKGKRMTFVPAYMARYYCELLGPLAYTGGTFWRYEKGVWKPFPEEALGNICTRALKENVQPSWIDGTIKILGTMVFRDEKDWPRYTNYVNCLDGMINVDTTDLEPHKPEFGSRSQVPCRYDWNADYPLWMTSLEEIFPKEPEKIKVLQEFFGYCLLQDCRFERAIFLYGTGANGKSTVLHVLRQMIGKENTSSLNISDLADRFSLYFLQGKLVNLATETTSRNPIATEIFKACVSGDSISAEKKYKEKFEFEPYAKFLIAMNDTPVIADKSYGFERKVIVLQFCRRFTEKERDVELKWKLEKERDGIFMWSLLGLGRLLNQRDFTVQGIVRQDTDKFMSALNPLIIFTQEELDFGPDEKELCVNLWQRYAKWCADGHNRALSRNRFYEQLQANFPSIQKGLIGDQRRNGFMGVSLKVLGDSD